MNNERASTKQVKYALFLLYKYEREAYDDDEDISDRWVPTSDRMKLNFVNNIIKSLKEGDSQ